MNTSLPGNYLAFDYGSKRIGVAVGHTRTGTAAPLIVVANHSGTPDWSAIDKAIADWQPAGLVVGIPLSLGDQDQPITPHARGFLKRLGKRYSMPVYDADERFTSIAAQEQLQKARARGQRGRTCKADIDTLAAALILEGWFAQMAAS